MTLFEDVNVGLLLYDNKAVYLFLNTNAPEMAANPCAKHAINDRING